eukprot:6170129-Pyramimonas_sp.AAC.1
MGPDSVAFRAGLFEGVLAAGVAERRTCKTQLEDRRKQQQQKQVSVLLMGELEPMVKITGCHEICK